MQTFPKRIKFKSTGEVLELEEKEIKATPTRLSYSMRGKTTVKPKVIEAKKMTYKYTETVSVRGITGNKLGTTIEFDLEYLTKIDSFDGLEY